MGSGEKNAGAASTRAATAAGPAACTAAASGPAATAAAAPAGPAGRAGVGVDVGSTATKVAVVDAYGELVYTALMPTGYSSVDAAARARECLEAAGFSPDRSGVRVVATGYGRVAVEYADYVITEITCHARGGREMGSDDCAVIDVGGQDTKVILISHGAVQDFLMNDKCSAGTGKFLEIMANRLGVDLGELFDMAEAGQTLSISSLCTVFAESEVISLLSQGVALNNIVAGVHKSIASKACSLAYRIGLEEKVVMCGGVAQDMGVVDAIEQELKCKVTVAPNPQITGALGAALLAYKSCTEKA